MLVTTPSSSPACGTLRRVNALLGQTNWPDGAITLDARRLDYAHVVFKCLWIVVRVDNDVLCVQTLLGRLRMFRVCDADLDEQFIGRLILATVTRSQNRVLV